MKSFDSDQLDGKNQNTPKNDQKILGYRIPI